MQCSRILRGLVHLKETAFRLSNYSIIDRLEVLKELGNVLRIDINGDVEAESSFRPHFEEIAVVEIMAMGFVYLRLKSRDSYS